MPLRAIAAVLVLAVSGAGCSGDGEESTARSFEPFQCQPLIQASSNIRLAAGGHEPEQLHNLIPLRFFYDEFRGDLPDELREEFKTVLEPYDAYLDAAMLTGGRVDPEALPVVVAAVDPEQLEEVVAGIDRDPFVAAATRINDWANTEC